jgi:hypothetical protein
MVPVYNGKVTKDSDTVSKFLYLVYKINEINKNLNLPHTFTNPHTTQ